MNNQLLKEYIKNILQESAINLDDHEKINDAIDKIKNSLSSEGLSLENLDCNSWVIAFLRDAHPIKDVNRDFTIPTSPMPKKRAISQNIQDFLKDPQQIKTLPGLGFNAVETFNKSSGYYINRINQLIQVYKDSKNPDNAYMFDVIISTLETIVKLKKAIENSGFKVLGAGIYRMVLSLPNVEDVVIKIGLSQKGRDDCLHEIEFSMGRSVMRRDHIDNFPRIFDYDQTGNGAWYAIEKVLFFNYDTFERPDVLRDFREQFPKTIEFFKKAGLTKYTDSTVLLIDYIAAMFTFSPDEITNAHHDYAKEFNRKKEESEESRTLVNKFISALKQLIGKDSEKEDLQHDAIVADNIFHSKILLFFFEVMRNIWLNRQIKSADEQIIMKQFINRLNETSPRDLRDVSNELGKMFDQAIISNIKDTHMGNLGFKKNNEGKWKLIFTDIDSKK